MRDYHSINRYTDKMNTAIPRLTLLMVLHVQRANQSWKQRGLITMNSGKLKVNLNHHIFMLYKSAKTCHPLSLPCRGTNILIYVTCGASFYLRLWSVQPPIQSLYPLVSCIYMQECSVHSLHMSSIPMGAMSELETCFEPE